MSQLPMFDMPLEEAMRTQRAIRRLKTDPVDDALVVKLIELALKAPTGSNAQNWEFVVVVVYQRVETNVCAEGAVGWGMPCDPHCGTPDEDLKSFIFEQWGGG